MLGLPSTHLLCVVYMCGHIWMYEGRMCMHVEAVGWCWESLLIALSSYSIKHGLWIKPEPAEELSLGRQLAPSIPCLCSPRIEWQEAHHAHSAFIWFLRIWTPVLRLILWLQSHCEYSQTLIMSYNISNILKNVQGHWLQYQRIQSETVARKKQIIRFYLSIQPAPEKKSSILLFY